RGAPGLAASPAAQPRGHQPGLGFAPRGGVLRHAAENRAFRVGLPRGRGLAREENGHQSLWHRPYRSRTTWMWHPGCSNDVDVASTPYELGGGWRGTRITGHGSTPGRRGIRSAAGLRRRSSSRLRGTEAIVKIASAGVDGTQVIAWVSRARRIG